MTAFGVVADGVVGTEADPVRDWPILPLLLRKLLLDHECLVRRLRIKKITRIKHKKLDNSIQNFIEKYKQKYRVNV